MRFVLAIFVFLVSAYATSAQQRLIVNQTQIKEVEYRLSKLGYWTGPVDGRFDPATRSALIAFQKWERRPVTGQLTLEELDAIRISAGPKARDAGYAHVEVDLDRQVLMLVNDNGVRVLPISSGTGKPFIAIDFHRRKFDRTIRSCQAPYSIINL